MEKTISSDIAVSSSPSAAVFSDELQRSSSPPSSPPGFPWDQAKSSIKVIPATKPLAANAFSVLGKRKALASIHDNARPKKRAAAQSRKASDETRTQMQISLGQEVQKKCKTCGMEYIASSAEDRRLHEKYHKQNTQGYDVGKAFVQRARPYSTFEGLRLGDTICALDCLDDFSRKRRGQDALEVVQRELGAVEIPERAVWDAGRHSLPTQPDYKAYLYVRGTKCIGVLLVQKIKEAYRVVEPVASSIHSETRQQEEHNRRGSARLALEARQQAEAERLQELGKQPLQLSQDPTPAVLGISRIWTSPSHRHQNIATALLDAAFKAHNERADQHAESKAALEADPTMPVQNVLALWARIDAESPVIKRLESKEDVAFSQPTEAGTRLARRWFGKMFGWRVYVD